MDDECVYHAGYVSVLFPLLETQTQIELPVVLFFSLNQWDHAGFLITGWKDI